MSRVCVIRPLPPNNSIHIIYITHIAPPSDELPRLLRTADSQSVSC